MTFYQLSFDRYVQLPSPRSGPIGNIVFCQRDAFPHFLDVHGKGEKLFFEAMAERLF